MRGANISEAFRRVWARPWLLMALALVNVGWSFLLSVPMSATLANLIDHRTAATAMAAGDDGLLFEFLTDHLEVAILAMVSTSVGVLVYGLWSWILDGGVLAALAIEGDRSARGAAEVLAESARRAGRMVKLGLFGTLLRVVPLLFGGLAYALARMVIKGRTFQPNLTTSMFSLVAAAVAWTAASIAIDYARGLSLDDPNTKSWRLLARGVKLLFVRGSATLQLIAFSMAAWLAVGVLYWVMAGHIGSLTLLTLLRLVAVVARVAITMTTLTAAAGIARS
jgi:hypothetical protein